MKLQRSTGVLLGAAIALVSTVAIIETTKRNRPAQGDTLYPFTEEDVDAFTINRSDVTLAFEKTDGTWQMTEPEDAPAEPSTIAFFLNLITTDPIEETIVVNADQLDDYGLDKPRATVDLTVLEDTYSFALGDEDFSGSSLYVMTTDITPETEAGELYLMPKSLQSSIGRRIDEWISAEAEEPTVDEKEEVEDEAAVEKEDASESADSEESQEEPTVEETDTPEDTEASDEETKSEDETTEASDDSDEETDVSDDSEEEATEPENAEGSDGEPDGADGPEDNEEEADSSEEEAAEPEEDKPEDAELGEPDSTEDSENTEE